MFFFVAWSEQEVSHGFPMGVPPHPKVTPFWIILGLKAVVFGGSPIFGTPHIGTVGSCLFDFSIVSRPAAAAWLRIENQEPMKTLQPHELQYCLEVIKEPVRKHMQRLCSSFETMLQNDCYSSGGLEASLAPLVLLGNSWYFSRRS